VTGLRKAPGPLSPRPRASSPTDPAEWRITEDGYLFGEGDRVWDYYDGRWVTVLEDPAATRDGWFQVSGDGGRASGSLNSVRVASGPPEDGRRPG
jgi:hypothetical protein